MTVERKRRAVYTVLSDVAEGAELWQAMWCWQDRYAQKSQFELNGFLSDCQHLPAIARDRSGLYRRLISSMMLAESSLKPDPFDEMQAFAEKTLPSEPSPTAASGDDWSSVVSHTLHGIFGALRSDTASAVGRYAMEQANRHRLQPELNYAFTLWLGNRQPLELAGVALAPIRQLLNYIYIALCETLGPVEADRILSAAVDAVPAEGSLDARRLL